MSFTNQKQEVATQAEYDSFVRCQNTHEYRCFLCGHRFSAGDLRRWVFNPKGPNAFVCDGCDTGDLEQMRGAIQQHYQAGQDMRNGPFWWIFTDEDQEQERRHVQREISGLAQSLNDAERELADARRGY